MSPLKLKEVMQTEYDAFIQNKTWDLVPAPLNQKIIACKWVFKIKHNSNGSISHYKARLVAKSFHQSTYIDYFETYSPVIKLITICVLFTLTITYNCPIRQNDINDAFLYGVVV